MDIISSLEQWGARRERDFSEEGLEEFRRSGVSGVFVNGGSGIGPDMIPAEALVNNAPLPILFPFTGQFAQEDIERRIGMTRQHGLNPWLMFWGIPGPDESIDSVAAESNHFFDRRTKLEMRITLDSHPDLFGARNPCVGSWRGSRPLCISHPDVQMFYRDLGKRLSAGYPELAGIVFMPGDADPECCTEGFCPRCAASGTQWENIVAHSNRIQEGLIESGSDVPFYFILWNIGLTQSTEINGANFLDWITSKLHPMTHMCISFSDTVRVERNGIEFTFNQPWSNMSLPGDQFKRLHEICTAQKRRLYVFAEICQSEVWDPVCHNFPTPLKVLQFFRNLESYSGVQGVIDFWGHRAPYLPHANLAMLRAYRSHSSESDEKILRHAVIDQYELDPSDESLVKAAIAAWMELDETVDKWFLSGWTQRFSAAIGRVGARGRFYRPLLPDMLAALPGSWDMSTCILQNDSIDPAVFCRHQINDCQQFHDAARPFDVLADRLCGKPGARSFRREGVMIRLAAEMIASTGRAVLAAELYRTGDHERLRTTISDEILGRRRALRLSASVGLEAGVPDFYAEEDIQLMSYYISHPAFPRIDMKHIRVSDCVYSL